MSGFAASACIFIEPSAKVFSMLCSKLLSCILKVPPCLSSSFILLTLYVRKSNDSSDCLRAADVIYAIEPLRRYHSESAHASDPAKLVLMFFLGMKIIASWKRTFCVPACTKPIRLYMMNLWYDVSKKGLPRSGVPSIISPC